MTNVVTSAEQERLLDEWIAAWSAHDLGRLVSIFTDNLIYEDVTMGRVNRTGAELQAFGQEFFSGFPDVMFELTSRFANGVWGGAEWVMRGTHTGDLPGLPASGKRIEIRGASILEFAGNKIKRCSDYWDMATFLTQLGFMPPPATAA
jgi:steroid delta-isomerase-like uncharacterized protein